MSSKKLDELVRKAEALTSDEQLLLIARLAEKMREDQRESGQRRKWREICGSAPYPLLGEDAQAWVSRTRSEGDEQREKQWRRKL